MVTHLAAQAMVMFGGLAGSQNLGDLWQLDPATGNWAQLTSGGGPSARYEHCMAYCDANQKVYLFGGSPFLADLWEYDLGQNSWQQKFPTATQGAPLGRRAAAMAYVNGAGVIVMFGGLRLGTARNDTWLYDPLQNEWLPSPAGTSPPARYSHTVSLDATGNGALMIGGTDSNASVFESTWRWDGNTFLWSEQLPAPEARTGVAMAYDTARSRHVVFGGTSLAGNLDLDETWEIDGLNWRRPNQSARPSPRSDAGMAFDRARAVMVLHGGRTTSGVEFGDTWEWNGSAWTPRVTPTTPGRLAGSPLAYDTRRARTWTFGNGGLWWLGPTGGWTAVGMPAARGRAAHCYDTVRNRMVMFGGTSASGAFLNETWEWERDGLWQQRAQGSGPSARTTAAMVFDSVRQVAVLIGGADSGNTPLAEVWTWNGVAWQAVASLPDSRQLASAVFDVARSRVVVFGGSNANGHYNDTMEWDGVSWVTRSLALQPSARRTAQMAYDPVRQRTVLFGGTTPASRQNDTWEYDGTQWVDTQLPANQRPYPKSGGAAVFDPRTSQVMVYSGDSDIGGSTFSFGDVWLWNGTAWSGPTTSDPPGARFMPVLFATGSAVPARTVLWSGATTADMFEWNGASWNLLGLGNSPAPRTNFGLTYDERRDRLVLFGGMTSNNRTGTTYFGDTWEWREDTGAWSQLSPTVTPSPRGWGRLAFDSARARVVLFGGADAANVFNDTWEWDGVTWTQRHPTASPDGSYRHDLAFDTSRRLTVLYGPSGLWDYGPLAPARITPFGVGCATSASAPPGTPMALRPLPWSGPWLADRLEMEFEQQPPGLGVFVWGFSNTTSPLGALPLPLIAFGRADCSLQVSPDISEVFLASRYVSFLLPSSTAFLGVIIFGQAGFFDAGAPGTIVTSNGAEMTFGQK